MLSKMGSFIENSITVNLLSRSNLFSFFYNIEIGITRDSRLVKSNFAFCSCHCDKATQEKTDGKERNIPGKFQTKEEASIYDVFILLFLGGYQGPVTILIIGPLTVLKMCL